MKKARRHARDEALRAERVRVAFPGLAPASRLAQAATELVRVLDTDHPPASITQAPFDYVAGHCERLCDPEVPPAPRDLANLALDLTYMPLQPELFRFLLPRLVGAWWRTLADGQRAAAGAFAEHWWPALHRGRLLGLLTTTERAAFEALVREVILERMAAETRLAFLGTGASPYEWIGAWTSYGMVLPDAAALWQAWWDPATRSSGQIVAAFQFASVLLYDDRDNPVFAPWTPEGGGGAPALWEPAGHLYDVGWRADNLAFLASALAPDALVASLAEGVAHIASPETRARAEAIVADLPLTRETLTRRAAELPALLATGRRPEP